jgi:hypothetical protein
MSITEIISAVRALPRDKKRRLTQSLLDEMENQETEEMFRGRHDFHVYTPEFGPGAVAQLAKVLEEDAKSR